MLNLINYESECKVAKRKEIIMSVEIKADIKKVYANVFGKVVYVNNKNNRYFQIHAESMDKKFRCVCDFFCPVREGDAVFGKCEYMKDERYGDQLIFMSAPMVKLGQDDETIKKCFLIALRGTSFGYKSAHELMNKLQLRDGSNAEVVECLNNVSSKWGYEKNEELLEMYMDVLTKEQSTRLLNWWYRNRCLRQLYVLGLSKTEIKMIDRNAHDIYNQCVINPLVFYKIPIEKAVEICNRINMEVSTEMIECGLMARKIYKFMKSNGWCGVPTNIFMSMFPTMPKQRIDLLIKEYGVVAEFDTLYLIEAYNVEKKIAECIHDLLVGNSIKYTFEECNLCTLQNNLTEGQIQAILGALKNNISIITGSGGTGKTTIIREIVHNLEKQGIPYKVVSFTGKAVSRLKEVIGKKHPSTMDRLICNPKEQGPFDHLIIDEISMVTTRLLYRFIKKFGSDYKITMVGDINQLRPIGWGALFEQLIKSDMIPTFRLNKIHRTTMNDKNGIYINSNKILECNGTNFNFEITKNFNILPGDISIVQALIQGLYNSGITSDNVTILSPYNKYIANINFICQTIYNKNNRGITDQAGQHWKIKDRVMMTKNCYEIDIMNKEEGTIIDIENGEIKVQFRDGTSHLFKTTLPEKTQSDDTYCKKEKKPLNTSLLQHSFCLTIDSAQGSEFSYVILFIPKSNSKSFMNRNRLYTALTRAKTAIWCVGDIETMTKAATKAPPYRCDNLSKRLISLNTLELTNNQHDTLLKCI